MLTTLAMISLAWSVQAKILVGQVNVQKVLVSIKQGQKVKKELEDSFNEKKKILQDEEAKIRKAQEEFQKKGLVMNDQAKAKKQEELQKMFYSFQQQQMKFNQEIQKQEADSKKPILDRLKPIIDSVSESNKVDLTVEVSTTPVLYAQNSKDLTSEVIAAYDKKHPK